MTNAEWMRIVARMRGWWPQAALPDSSLALWFDDLRGQAAVDVLAAVGTAYRDGEQWPPNGAQILQRLATLRVDAPPFDRVWTLGHQAAGRFGRRRAIEAHAWLTDQLGETAANVVIDDWQAYCDGLPSDRTRFAQTRDVYAERQRAAVRQTTHAGLGLPARRGEPYRLGDAIRELAKGQP